MMKTCKQIFLCLFFIMVVTSCANAAPTPFASSTAAETATRVATQTPSSTPTAVPTPTEAGPKVGDTKVENGFTYTYTEVKSPDGVKEYAGYFRPLAVNIPFIDNNGMYAPILGPDGKSVLKNPDGKNQWQGAKSIGPTTVYVELGVQDEFIIKSIGHTPHPIPFQKTTQYEDRMLAVMLQHYFHTDNSTQDQNDVYFAAIQSGKVSYTFTDGSKTYTWPFSPESGATVYVVNYNNVAPTAENGVKQWSAAPSNHVFRTAFWGVDQKGIIGMIASEKPFSELTDFELRMLPIWHIAVVMHNADVTKAGFDQFVQEQVQMADKQPWPQLTIER